MSESKNSVAGVTYTKAGEGYFEKRQLKRSAGFWGLWGLGVAAVISGDFSGWNFGIGFAGFGGMLIAFAHHRRHVLRHDLLDRRDGGRDAAHRRRVLVRPLGDGPVGRVRHGPRRDDRVRLRRPAVIVLFSAAYADSIIERPCSASPMPQPGCGGSSSTRCSSRSTPPARRISFSFAIVVSILSIAYPGAFGDALVLRRRSTSRSSGTSRPTAGQTAVPAVRLRAASCSRCRSRCGSSSASRSSRSPPRSRTTPRRTSRARASGPSSR